VIVGSMKSKSRTSRARITMKPYNVLSTGYHPRSFSPEMRPASVVRMLSGNQRG
jgi:hypothetical protein